MNSRRTDSIESLANYLARNVVEFEDTNPGPLFPLSEYGNTCFVSSHAASLHLFLALTCRLGTWLTLPYQMRGCEELHIECADKTNHIVEHCDCNPAKPNIEHRHIFDYCDLLSPPPERNDAQLEHFDMDMEILRRLLIISHPHYPRLSKTNTNRSSMVDTPTNGDSNDSSESSFEIQIRTTTPEADFLSNTAKKTSEDAGDLLSQVSLAIIMVLNKHWTMIKLGSSSRKSSLGGVPDLGNSRCHFQPA